MESKLTTEFSQFTDGIKAALSEVGFKKKGLTWEKDSEEILLMINLQKSQFGNNVYANYGIFICEIEPDKRHSVAHCHIRGRLDSEIGNDALDFDSPMMIGERIKKVTQVIKKNRYSFFTLSGTKSNLRKFISESGTLVVTGKAKSYLGMQKLD